MATPWLINNTLFFVQGKLAPPLPFAGRSYVTSTAVASYGQDAGLFLVTHNNYSIYHKVYFHRLLYALLKRHLNITLEDDAIRAPGPQEPRIGFVFTGQGAQWALMSVELMQRRVVADLETKPAELLREFGINRDPLTFRYPKENISFEEAGRYRCHSLYELSRAHQAR
ncbi:hypothetical protein LY76DRAFT_608342 [Colletotrichum caudatum]|nr:hypothetical protein LY76DRAFT_608342 [Colletotrichum caudatum]